jgi:hypothetical protein
MDDVGLFYGHLDYCMAIWSISWSFGIFYGHFIYFVAIWYIFPVLVCWTKKNLATLYPTRFSSVRFGSLHSVRARLRTVGAESQRPVREPLEAQVRVDPGVVPRVAGVEPLHRSRRCGFAPPAVENQRELLHRLQS